MKARKKLGFMQVARRRQLHGIIDNLVRNALPQRTPALEDYARCYTAPHERWGGAFEVGNMYGMPTIWDAFQDPDVRQVIVMSGTQVGKTAFLNLSILWAIEHLQAQIIVCFATKRLLDSAVANFNEYAIHFPKIQEMETQIKKRDSTKNDRRFVNGGRLLFQYSGESGAMKGTTADYVYIDEFDVMRGGMKMLEEAQSRVKMNYSKSKIVCLSAPNHELERSLILQAFEAREKREWHLRCPNCKTLQRPSLEGLVGETQFNDITKRTGMKLGTPVFYRCVGEGCNYNISQDEWWDCWKNGEWHSEDKFVENKRVSYWLSGMGCYDLDEIYSRRVDSDDEMGRTGQDDLARSLHNDILGYPLSTSHYQLDIDRAMLELQRDYNKSTMPDDISFITAGIDCQRDYLAVSVYGWGLHGDSSILKCVGLLNKHFNHKRGGHQHSTPHIEGSSWNRACELLLSYKAQTKTAFHKDYVIDACFIDSGYKPEVALGFCRYVDSHESYGRFIHGTHGVAIGKYCYQMFNETSVPYRTPKPTSAVAIGVNLCKTKIFTLAKSSMGLTNLEDANFVVPRNREYGFDRSFWNEFTNETSIRKNGKNGTYISWSRKKSGANESFDCAVLSYGSAEFYSRLHGYESLVDFLVKRRENRYSSLISLEEERTRQEIKKTKLEV